MASEARLLPFQVRASDRDGDDGGDAPGDLQELPPQPTPAQARAQTAQLLVLSVLFLLTSVVNYVLYKLASDALGEHLNFARQQIGVLWYDVMVTLVCVGTFFAGRCAPPIATPLWAFAAVGFVDASGDFLASASSSETSGPLQTLLSQLTIPATLAFSTLLLRGAAVFSAWHYAGAFVVVVGSAVAAVPQFEGASRHAHRTWWAPLIFALGQLPEGLSVVLKNKIFLRERRAGRPLFVLLLSALVSWCQLACAWLFVPLESIDGLGGVALDDVGPVLGRGWRCFAGERVLKHPGAAPNATDFGERCAGSRVTVVTLLFAAMGVVNGYLWLAVVDHPRGGAALSAVLSALCLPLANLAYAVPWTLLWPAPTAVTGWDVASLVLTVVGMLVYQLPELRERFCAPPPQTDDAPTSID